jgi:hypothetical protein
MEARARGHNPSDGIIVQSDTPPPLSAKALIVKPISATDANRIVKSLHYSGKVVPNSQIHLGVFLNGKCGGAMQFGPSMRKDLIQPLVFNTGWNEFIELNRMAFADWLPRNGESRCIGYAMRWIKKTYPWIKWVISFADGTQCGDGTIYRASGFALTGIKKNTELKIDPRTGKTMATMAAYHKGYASEISTWKALPGFQLRYIYFIDPTARDRLTVPIIPFSEIDRRGAGMYKGKQRKQSRAGSDTKDTSANLAGEGGSTPTPALQSGSP